MKQNGWQLQKRPVARIYRLTAGSATHAKAVLKSFFAVLHCKTSRRLRVAGQRTYEENSQYNPREPHPIYTLSHANYSQSADPGAVKLAILMQQSKQAVARATLTRDAASMMTNRRITSLRLTGMDDEIRETEHARMA